MTAFAINPNATVHLAAVGDEREPLIVVDNLMADPEALVSLAAEGATYGPAGAAYPGLRASLPDAYNFALHGALRTWLRDTFNIPDELAMTLNSSFALITDPADRLKPLQRIPHVDMHGDYNLAMVHYLCGPEFGGTSFFRHRSTGFETIREARKDAYDRALNVEMNSQVVSAAFPDETHPFFDHLATINSAFNRIVIYRACLLHSPAIRRGSHFSADPRQGRLTITAFLNPNGR